MMLRSSFLVSFTDFSRACVSHLFVEHCFDRFLEPMAHGLTVTSLLPFLSVVALLGPILSLLTEDLQELGQVSKSFDDVETDKIHLLYRARMGVAYLFTGMSF